MGTVDRPLPPRSDMEQQQPPATCWTNLLETTFNKVNDILGDVCVVEEMMSTEEDMIEQAVTIDLLSDSRLDANSVLIDDIKLGEEANMDEEEKMVSRDRSYSWHGGKFSSSRSSSSSSRLPRETAFDQRIRLLQEELDSMSRDQEILNINQYASVSNNPCFLGVEGVGNSSEKSSSLFTLKPREDRDVMRAALAQELDIIPSGVPSLQSVR